MERMKIVVRPKFERARWFRDIIAAMRFAEAARRRQGPLTRERYGAVHVDIYDGYTPYAKAQYGAWHSSKDYRWSWTR